MTHYYAIRPIDVVSVRSNRSFGASGEHGESLMPPWPSLFAGALRAEMLGRDPAVLGAFGPGRPKLLGELGEVLGTPEVPGSFRLTWSSLACEQDGVYSPSIPLPSDLVAISRIKRAGERLHWIRPIKAPAGIRTSSSLPLLPVLKTEQLEKPAADYWLGGQALQQYLDAGTPETAVPSSRLYEREIRVGIGLDHGSRTVKQGLIYSTDTISFAKNTHFLVGIDGLGRDPEELLPSQGLLRLGGDGRGAVYRRIPGFQPVQMPIETIQRDLQFRLVLRTPAIFSHGWLPEGTVDGTLHGIGFSARLAAASIARHEIVSGWDLANWMPKPAVRVVPAGSVYWFNQLEGDPSKLADWVNNGLWGDTADVQRRAEGFNQAMLAAWPKTN